MSILKSDYTAEGHKLGLNDATSGDKPNKKGVKFHWEMLKKGFRVLNHNQAMKTFSQGYETGFTDGLRKREGLYGNTKENDTVKSNNDNSITMSSNPENLAKQIELLHSFENFLSNVQTNLNEVNSVYAKLIDELYNGGLVGEYAEKLKQDNHAGFNAHVAKINQWIDEHDKKYARQVAGQVKDAM